LLSCQRLCVIVFSSTSGVSVIEVTLLIECCFVLVGAQSSLSEDGHTN
jgi:hypothetical protein